MVVPFRGGFGGLCCERIGGGKDGERGVVFVLMKIKFQG